MSQPAPVHRHLASLAIAVVLAAPTILRAEEPAAARAAPPSLRDIIERHAADDGALDRRFAANFSPARAERLRKFYEEETKALEALEFEALDGDGRIDWLLLRNRLRHELRELGHEEKRFAEVAELLPFAGKVLELEEARRRMEPLDPRRAAEAVAALPGEVERARKGIEERSGKGEKAEPAVPTPAAARRAAGMVDSLKRALQRWRDFYAGYDPSFTWWVEEPWKRADKALADHASFLRRKLAGFVEGQEEPIIGDPIGREALLHELEAEMIALTPEELLEVAAREFAWCEGEMARAARDLGAGSWKEALEKVKGLHVEPGKQPALIRELAEEAVKFLEERDLVTIPPVCKETWRMEMMSPERQRVNPYFTGGEVISVSFPTAGMSHEEKLMSLRGNNIHFCRATVHHELIPGHHLQGFMGQRHRPHRRLFRTAFLVEGWPLYWEMLLWDLGFPKSAEDRVGMLFWRSHRCARIVFSLSFHLGKMSPKECIDYLVEKVGHERSGAEAEVRRSLAGNYGPLYQAAYMVGGLQLRALRRELVESGRLSDRAFHDAVLRENAIPIELIRASLAGLPLSRGHQASWRFHEAKPAAAAPATPAKRTEEARGSREQIPPRIERRVYRDRVEPRWLPGGERFWYRVDLPGGGREFVMVDAAAGKKAPAFDHARAAAALAPLLGRVVEAHRLPIDDLEPSADGKSMLLRGERSFRLDLESHAAVEEKVERGTPPEEPRSERDGRGQRGRRRPAGPRPGDRSPDGRWEVFVHGHDLRLRGLSGQGEKPLTHDGNPAHSYARGSARSRAVELEPEGEAEPAAPDVRWSPDSKRLVAMRTRAGAERSVYLVESSPRDQLQPKLHSYPYLKPGDELPRARPYLFDVEAGREVPLGDGLFPNPWSIEDVRWSPDSSRFTFIYNERGHQVLRLIAVDARTGEARAIVDEKSATFIDYAHKRFTEHLDAAGEVLWMSERDGWNHLWLHDASTGAVKNQVTRGEWVVRSVERVDAERRQVWFFAGGVRPERDPYQLHLCRVGLDGSGMAVLTEGDGTHSVQFSPDRRWFIDTWSRVDLPPVTELRRSDDGSLVVELERGDADALFSAGWRPPERFVAKGRDGVTDIHGVIHWPADLKADRKYPVVESIYAGPHASFVPRTFRTSYGQEELTSRGFIVVQIDGMGTSHRSKKFHDVAWRNLGDSGFPDRILWMKAAAEKHAGLDLARVGLYGGSAGGQSAVRGLLAHGDFYKAGAADCGCHDNRMDKVWWNELWMGWPPGPHYAEQSNVTQAHRLQGKLLLTVGELDRNVDPSSTMQLVDALIRADKDFELIVVPGAGHGAGESPYCRRRRAEFFERHLGGEKAQESPAVTSGARDPREF